MELNEYQKQAMQTCLPSCENVGYMLHNLIGEVGETAEKIENVASLSTINGGENFLLRDLKIIKHVCQHYGKTAKKIRTDENEMYRDAVDDLNAYVYNASYDESQEIEKELGDVLWQLSGLCNVLGYTLEDVAKQNLKKLSSRMERGVIDGNGDNR